MKIKCSQTSLAKGVNSVSKAVPVRTTMSILECILIDATTDKIRLTANDLEMAIETLVDGEILDKGVIAIEARIFSEIVRKLPESEVTIETNDNYETMITCDSAKFSIFGRSGEDFSAMPYYEKNRKISLPQFSLKEMIRQTIFSISDNESINKPMTGELFEVEDATLKVVSLDGYRISLRKEELSRSYESRKVIVPGKTLMEIIKILPGEADKEADIYFTANHIIFEFDDTVVLSRLIDGEYFRINQMLSGDYEIKVVANKRYLLSCLDRASLLVKENDKKPIILSIGDDRMKLGMKTVLGTMNEEIPVAKEGPDLMIGFNTRYLMDALRVIEDEEVTLYFTNAKAPCIIKNSAETYIYLILPVNFQNEGR